MDIYIAIIIILLIAILILQSVSGKSLVETYDQSTIDSITAQLMQKVCESISKSSSM